MSAWRKIRVGLPLMALLAFIAWAYLNWYSYEKIHPLKLIPTDAVIIVESHRPLVTWNGLVQSPFWKKLSTHPDLEELSENANTLDNWIRSSPKVSHFFGDHHLIFSIHMTAARDYDFLFAFDLENASGLSIDRLPLDRLLGDSFELRSQDYRDRTIHSILASGEREALYVAQLKNYLLLSFKKELVHAAIDQGSSETEPDPEFELAYKRIAKDRLGQCYIHFKRLPQFAGVYLNDIGGLGRLGQQLAFAAIDVDLKPKRWTLDGFTSLDPERSTYARLLQHYGRGKLGAHRILSRRAAYLQSVHVDNAEAFYTQLMLYRERDPQGVKDYAEMKQQIEGILDLRLEDQLVSWIGDEIVIAEWGGPADKVQRPGRVVAIKARDIGRARKELERIQEEIIHRTPARFSSFVYKGYSIHFLEWKWFFRLLLGSSSRGMLRPYYTIVDGYVVFSDGPESLITLLEDMENGEVLSRDPDFEQFVRKAGKDYSSLSYVNAHWLYPVLRARVHSDQRAGLAENMDYFSYLDHWMLVLRPDAQGFSNSMEVSYDRSIPSWPEAPDQDSLNTLFKINSTKRWLNRQADPDYELTAKLHRRFYPGSKQTIFEMHRKNGVPHGDYREYYENGSLRCKGSYRKGIKKGKWEWYDAEGKLVRTN